MADITEEMVEAAAEAFTEALSHHTNDRKVSWADVPQREKDDARRMVRAALTAALGKAEPVALTHDDEVRLTRALCASGTNAYEIAPAHPPAARREAMLEAAKIAETRMQNHAALNVQTKTRGGHSPLIEAREDEARSIATALSARAG